MLEIPKKGLFYDKYVLSLSFIYQNVSNT